MLLSGVNLLLINLFTFTVTGFKHKNKLISISTLFGHLLLWLRTVTNI